VRAESKEGSKSKGGRKVRGSLGLSRSVPHWLAFFVRFSPFFLSIFSCWFSPGHLQGTGKRKGK
jgi:hypothetical protein